LPRKVSKDKLTNIERTAEISPPGSNRPQEPDRSQIATTSTATAKRSRKACQELLDSKLSSRDVQNLYLEKDQVSQLSSARSTQVHAKKQQSASLVAWLKRVHSSLSGEESLTEVAGNSVADSSEQEMQSSTSASRISRDSVADESTVKGRGSRGPLKLNWDKLRAREINDEPSEDDRLVHFKFLLKLDLPRLSAKQIKDLQSSFKVFAELAVKEVDLDKIEALSDEFDQWKSKVGLAKITREHFKGDLTRCAFSNEAMLQRTIMMEIIDRHHLHDFLTFNSEGQWRQNKNDCLISKDSDSVTLPKPDLNMSFNLKSFDKLAPIPKNLRSSFRPDSSGQKYGRCFPFLFFEVKKATDNLEVAEMANLHSASQALFNIYAWMARTNQGDLFIKKIRVFTFVFNTQDLSVRMHRATAHEITGLQYHFVELVELKGYSKDQVCLLVRKILEKYAIQELHPILKLAFDTVTDEHSRATQAKRRADFARATADQRARSRRTLSVPIDDAASFGLSGLAT
jgi:hypothetical protein